MDEYWVWKKEEQKQHCEIGEVTPVMAGV